MEPIESAADRLRPDERQSPLGPGESVAFDGLAHRRRLTARIAHAARRPVVLLAAPAGFGKSVALRHFLIAHGIEHGAYAVHPATTLLGFLRGLAAALGAIVPAAYVSFAVAHDRAMQSSAPVADLVAWFGEHVRGVATTIVVDDLHHADGDPRVLEFLIGAIEATREAGLRWIVALRSSHALPVASWLAHDVAELPLEDAELRFDGDDARMLARAFDKPIDDALLEAVRAGVDGWAAGLALGVALSDDPGTIALMTRGRSPADEAERLQCYRMLARRFLDREAWDQRTFMVRAAVLVDQDPATLRAAGWPDADARLREIASEAPFLLRGGADGVLRYDGLFRELLQDELRTAGERTARAAVLRAARALEATDRAVEALALYHEVGAGDDVTRIIDADGLRLVERGNADVVEAAIAPLAQPEVLERTSPMVLAIKGVLDARVGHADTSEAWFRIALSAADDRQRPVIVYRYALELIRRGRTDVLELLEPFAEAAGIEPELHVLIRSTLATAYAIAERLDDARRSIERVLQALDAVHDDQARARIFHQIAYVALRCGDDARARRFAQSAIEIALRLGLFDLASRSYTVLYELAHLVDDDRISALGYIDRVAECSIKSGNRQTRLWALLSAYGIEAERGDAAALIRIEQALAAADIAQGSIGVAEVLLPSQAMRAGWQGNFRGAYGLMLAVADRSNFPEDRALCWSEAAMYAAAAGLKGEARAAAATALRELHGVEIAGKIYVEAVAYVALAAMLLTRFRSADRHLRRIEAVTGPETASLHALVGAVRALLDWWSGAVDGHGDVRRALATLRERHVGGIAALLESLPTRDALGRRRAGRPAIRRSRRDRSRTESDATLPESACLLSE